MRYKNFLSLIFFSISFHTFLFAYLSWNETELNDFVDGFFFRSTATTDGKLKVRLCDDWWDTSWPQRIPIEINTVDINETLYDYQIWFITNTKALVDAGKLDPAGTAIRIAGPDGKTLIPFWIENWNITTSTGSKIWVKVPQIPPNTKTQIYMYIRNVSTNSLSDKDAVFDLYEDWETGQIRNVTPWSATGWVMGGYYGDEPRDYKFEIHTSTDVLYKADQSTGTLQVFEGKYCVRSSTIPHAPSLEKETYVYLQTSINLSYPARVEFYWACYSEKDDYLSFYIGADEKEKIGGNVGWRSAGFNLLLGENTLRWKYRKDYGGSLLFDRGFVDKIVVRKYNSTFDSQIAHRVVTKEIEVWSQYFKYAEYWSNVFDTRGENTKFIYSSWTEVLNGQTVEVYARSADYYFTILSTYPSFSTAELPNPGDPSGLLPRGRYVQYKVVFRTGGTTTPEVSNINFTYQPLPLRAYDFNGIALSSTSIKWSWAHRATYYIDGYRIYSSTRQYNKDGGYLVITSTAEGLIAELPPDATYWIEENLQPNTQYGRYVVAYTTTVVSFGGNASKNISGSDGPRYVYTLALEPQCAAERYQTTGSPPYYQFVQISTEVWYNTKEFSFTSAISIGVAYYRYIFDTTTTWDYASSFVWYPTSQTYIAGNGEQIIERPILRLTPSKISDSLYFQVKSYNHDHIESGYQILGPFWFNGIPFEITTLIANPGQIEKEIILSWISPQQADYYEIRYSSMPVFEGFEDDNISLGWETGGDAVWFIDTSNAFSGKSSARAGIISHNQSSWIQRQIYGPCRLTFFWKASCEDNNRDYLSFCINNAEKKRIQGDTWWRFERFDLPSGEYIIKWIYQKDSSVTVGADTGWIDNIGFEYINIWDSFAVWKSSFPVKGYGSAETETISGLTPGVTYYFLIRAYDETVGGWSHVSNMASAWAQFDNVPPAAVSTIFAYPAEDEGAVVLSWLSPGDNGWSNILQEGSQFKIQYSTWTEIIWSTTNAQITVSTFGVIPLTFVSYVIANLSPGVTYYFRIWYCDEVKNWSIGSAVATSWAQSLIVIPYAPTNFTAVSRTTTSITWSWIDNALNEEGYRIRDKDGNIIVSLPANTTFWAETSLSVNTSYYRYVEAFNIKGSSASNECVAYTLANVPTEIQILEVSTTTITLRWSTNNNPPHTQYLVLYSTNNFVTYISTVVCYNLDISSITFALGNLQSGKEYWLKVNSINGDGIITESDVIISTITHFMATGRISGKVVKSDLISGIEGVKIEIIGIDNSVIITTATNTNGEYTVNLPMGVYLVRAVLAVGGGDSYKISVSTITNVLVNENETVSNINFSFNYMGNCWHKVYSTEYSMFADGMRTPKEPMIGQEIKIYLGNNFEYENLSFATLYYKKLNEKNWTTTNFIFYSSGVTTEVINNNYWVATIPAQSSATVIQYYIKAVYHKHEQTYIYGNDTRSWTTIVEEDARSNPFSFCITGTGGISGKVMDKTGNGISGVSVYVWTYDIPHVIVSTATTIDDGSYIITGLPEGKYRVGVSGAWQRGYVDRHYNDKPDRFSSDPVYVKYNEITENINFVLPKLCKISGRVVDQFGNGFEGVTVEAIEKNWNSWARPRNLHTGEWITTSSTGYYEIVGLLPGKYKIRAWYGEIEKGAKYVYYNQKPNWGQANEVDLKEGDEVENINFVLTKDVTPPDVSIKINNDAVSTYIRVCTITVMATDDLTGVDKVRFSNDNLNWSDWFSYSTTTVNNFQWVLPEGVGIKTVYAQARDNAGNVSLSVFDTIELLQETIRPPENVIVGTRNWWGTQPAANLDNKTGQVTIYIGSLSDPPPLTWRIFFAYEPDNVELILPNGERIKEKEKIQVSTPKHGWEYVFEVSTQEIRENVTRITSWTGELSVSLEITYKGQKFIQQLGKVTLHDPSGYVYNILTNELVSGATVTLYRFDIGTGEFEFADPNIVAMEPKINPQITDVYGRYGWDVEPGRYYVKVEAAWYETAISTIVTIPPPVTDLNIGLTPTDITPPVASISIKEGSFIDTPEVTLFITAYDTESGIRGMRISEKPDLSDTTWEVYNSTRNFRFSLNKGKKYVYLEVKDNNGNICKTSTFVSFVAQSLKDAHPYPNPYKPNSNLGHTGITFTELPARVRIRIFTINGDLVYDTEEITTDGTYFWEGINQHKEKLASGLYIYLITTDNEKKTGKIVIIR